MNLTDTSKLFMQIMNEDKAAEALRKRVVTGKATYSDACMYADKVGDICSRFLQRYANITECTEEELIDVAERLVKPTIQYAQKAVNNFTQGVQKLNNSRAGVNIAAAKVTPDADRVNNLVTRIIDDAKNSDFLIQKPALQNVMKDVVTSNARANASLHSDAGLTVKISRSTGAGCCEWCESMAGIYDYGDQPEDFFLAHRNCTCVWSTYTSKRSITTMHFETDENGDLHRTAR